MANIYPPSAVLLLPPPPSLDFEQLAAAYRPPLSGGLGELARNLQDVSQMLKTPALHGPLDIAICMPGLNSPSCLPRSRVLAPLQRLVADMYRLIGTICTEHNIELDGPGGLHPGVIFLDYDPTHEATAGSTPQTTSLYGPVIELHTLAKCGRPWHFIYFPDNATGRKLGTNFLRIYSSSQSPVAAKLQLIPGGPEKTSSEPLLTPGNESAEHYSVAVGGTFDHIHLGHKLLLTVTALALEPIQGPDSGERKLTVGLTGDKLLVNKKYAQILQNWDERSMSVMGFLSLIMDFRPPGKNETRMQDGRLADTNERFLMSIFQHGLAHASVEISDQCGPTTTDEKIDSLVVSKETRSGGAAINQERAKKGWRSLDAFEVDVLQPNGLSASEAENFASKLSSTEIRRRRLNTGGC